MVQYQFVDKCLKMMQTGHKKKESVWCFQLLGCFKVPVNLEPFCICNNAASFWSLLFSSGRWKPKTLKIWVLLLRISLIKEWVLSHRVVLCRVAVSKDIIQTRWSHTCGAYRLETSRSSDWFDSDWKQLGSWNFWSYFHTVRKADICNEKKVLDIKSTIRKSPFLF